MAIAARWFRGLALLADETVTAWGWNGRQTAVPTGLSNVVAISAGENHTLALVGEAPLVFPVVPANPVWSRNGVSISLPTQSGRVYRLEYENSLADPLWTALPLLAGNGGMQRVTDFTATVPQRLCRLGRW